jgi:hypothetical protein
MNESSFRRLRIAIIGGCQVVGLGAAAERLLPGAEVKIWHVGVYPKDTDEELLELLTSFDVVISQLSDWEPHVPLRITRLREQGLPVIYLPVAVFPGFHPDTTYIRQPNGLVHGLMTDYHSVIVAAVFSMGLPERRVPDLFNAFIFSELGYFDVFEEAKAALFANFAREGFDICPLFDLWIKQAGQFMYTVNHPHILVSATLCRLALVRAELLDPATPLPDDIADGLAGTFFWPIYPALARRIGLPGSTSFLRDAHGVAPGQLRELPLAEYISGCYSLYGGLAKDTLRVGSVATACERLDRHVVI